MKKMYFLLLVSLISLGLQAQVVFDYLRGADEYFRKGDYFSAANYYEKYLAAYSNKLKVKNTSGYAPYSAQAAGGRKGNTELSNKEQAMFNLAECYRMLHYHEKAEPAYQQTLTFDKEKFPLTKYWYAMTLRAMKKYAESEAAFKQFLSEYAGNDNYKELATREVKNLEFAQKSMTRKDLSLFTVGKAEGELKDSCATYAPIWFRDDVYFTSTMPDKSAGKLKSHDNRVYQGNFNEGKVTGIKKISVPDAKNMQQGVVSFTPDGNIMYVTTWKTVKGKKMAVLSRSIRMSGNSWSAADPITSGINMDGYSSQQPCVMPDGKTLLFSSDMPGGSGGFDLWMAPIDVNGREGKPVNLGSVINTKGDDQAPYYHAASKTLVYSSNGMVGMGGFDFYYSKGMVDNWKAPVNFGHPVNSVKDDIYFASRGGAKNILEDVLMSSDRNDVCCLELFTLHKKRLPKTISGKIINCKDKAPMAGVAVSIIDTINNKVLGDLKTDASGVYSITLEDFQPLKTLATFKGFYNDSLSFTGPADDEELEFMNPELCLQPFPVENPFVMKNVLYDFDSVSFQPASVYELDRLVAMLTSDTAITIEIGAHTDSKGTPEYNLTLSTARAKSVVKYLLNKGINAGRLSFKGYGETMPIALNENPDGTDNPEGRQLNRRTEVKILNQKPMP